MIIEFNDINAKHLERKIIVRGALPSLFVKWVNGRERVTQTFVILCYSIERHQAEQEFMMPHAT